ncbi:MAG: hypothetical protein IKP00_05970 [Victivallales bacterium]|nr:hypothetical protein [Victivallales bacterium]
MATATGVGGGDDGHAVEKTYLLPSAGGGDGGHAIEKNIPAPQHCAVPQRV